MNEQPTQETSNKKNSFLTPLLASGAFLLLFILYTFIAGGLTRTTDTEGGAASQTAVSGAFDSLTLLGKSAYVFDVLTGTTLYEKNSELQLPLASVTKLMLAAVAADTLDSGPITITKRDLRAEGDSGLRAGERWTLQKLLSLTLLTSSNDGATAIASVIGGIASSSRGETWTESKTNEASFVALMNEKAKALGLAQTYFLNPTGLDATKNISGGYGSARDVAALLAHLLIKNPELLDATGESDMLFRSLSNITHKGKNTDPLVATVPGVLASKTGYTDLAGGNLALAFDAGLGHPVVAVVLGSTYDGRFSDIRKLIAASMETITAE